jgi:hypothetical protein
MFKENCPGIFSLTGAAFNCSSYQHPRRLRVINRLLLPGEDNNWAESVFDFVRFNAVKNYSAQKYVYFGIKGKKKLFH